MQADLSECADLCFGKSLNKTSHEIPLCGYTHVPRRPYASHQQLLGSFVRYGRYGKEIYKSSFRQNNPAFSACRVPLARLLSSRRLCLLVALATIGEETNSAAAREIKGRE